MSLPHRIIRKYDMGMKYASLEELDSWNMSLNLIKDHLNDPYPSALCVLHNVWGHFKRLTIATPEDVDLIILQKNSYINPRISNKINVVHFETFDVKSLKFKKLLSLSKNKRVRVEAKKKLPLKVVNAIYKSSSDLELCIENIDILDVICYINPLTYSKSLKNDKVSSIDTISLIETKYGRALCAIKPPNLQSVPGPRDKDSMQSRFPGWTAVHRLDYASSGLLVLAETKSPLVSIFRYLFAAEMTEKRYRVRLSLPLTEMKEVCIGIEESKDVSRMLITNTNKVKTIFKPLNILEDKTTIALAIIKTGKRHQVRLSALAINNPLVGDKQYLSKSSSLYKQDMLLECVYILFDMSSVYEEDIVFETS